MQANIIVSSLFCVLFSPVIHAEYDVTDLGKLFTDKSQRTQIDAARSGKATANKSKETSKVKVSGYVTRSDGDGVVWVNDKNSLENTKLDDIKVHQSSIGKNKKVTLSVGGETKSLKPGETWNKQTGKVIDTK
jgi:hypothetical protein